VTAICLSIGWILLHGVVEVVYGTWACSFEGEVVRARTYGSADWRSFVNGKLILLGVVSLVEGWDMTWGENVVPSR
jgi:hypothetical protein